MKKEIEISAKTKEEAIARAVAELGAPSEAALVVTVVREARKGFLGFGAVDATIKAVYQVPDPVPAGADAAEQPRRERRDRGEGRPRREKPAYSPRRDAPAPAAVEGQEGNVSPAPEETARPRPADIDPASATESEQRAYRFLVKLVENMGLTDVRVAMHPGDNEDMVITIDGTGAGVLIGHHGDTLDALQYLANLAANRKEEGEKREFARITVDVEDYRAKREDALRSLARKKAAQVLKYKKSVMLEPMNPYERRIIHSEIQRMEGVATNSIGAENNRRVVIFLEEEGIPTTGIRPSAAKGTQPKEQDGVTGERAGAGRPRRRKGKVGPATDPLAPATRREPRPSLFDENDSHDPFDIDLSAALPPEDADAEETVTASTATTETEAGVTTTEEVGAGE
jgi:spoIIIJ-associated protein